MTYDELINLPNGPLLVLLTDGNVGMLTVFEKERMGVQVPGEEYHRWVAPGELEPAHKGSSLRQIGSPALPAPPAGVDMEQKMLLAVFWSYS